MNIVMDAFGGDNAPLEVIKGAVDAQRDFGVDITLVGDEKKIKDCAKKNSLDISALKIKHADTVIEICEEPTEVIKGKKDCSMAVGMQMLADGEGDAFVSAGSTGALVVGATFIVKRIKGIKRPALATVLPTAGKPTMLLDSGANADCRPEMLVQFGIMGSAYMNKILNVDKPRVALANIGAEESKGRELELETYKQLKTAPVNFVGNIEARQLPLTGKASSDPRNSSHGRALVCSKSSSKVTAVKLPTSIKMRSQYRERILARARAFTSPVKRTRPFCASTFSISIRRRSSATSPSSPSRHGAAN